MRNSSPRSLLALAVASLACASGPPSHVGDGVHALRRPHGVCAGTEVEVEDFPRLRITGCLRTGTAGSIFDNDEARLVTLFEARDADDADLTDWQLLLLRDGEQILIRALDAGPSHRRCAALGRCAERVADVVAVPGGLGPGTYTLRYRLMSGEAYVARVPPAELTIVLR
jgi:hypothetical protein